MDNKKFKKETNDNGTTLIPAKCTNCGGILSVDASQEAAVCQFCGTPFIVSKAVQNYNVQHNTYQTNVVNQSKKGAVESILNYASDRQDKKQKRLEEERIRKEEKRKKRNKNILWALGWIFIFPVPLTILMLRQKEMNKKLKYGIIAAGWVAYIILLLISGCNSRKTKPPIEYTNNTPAVTAAYEAETHAETTARKTTAVTERKTETKTTEKAASETTASETEEISFADVKKAVENGDYSLVTPEFKETMDDYEAFIDEYIAFMKKYNSGDGDIMSMMNDYTKMLDKEMEWADKIDAIDEKTLSPADDAYYLLVTLRVEEKLLGLVY